MSGWVGQRCCAECAYEGPEPDFSAVGLDEYGNPYIVNRLAAGALDVIVCRGCAGVLSRLPREAMARAIVRLLRRLMTAAS